MLSTIRTLLINDSEIAAIVGTNVFVGFATKEVVAPYIILDEIFKNPNDCKVELSTVDSYMFATTAVDTMYSTVETLLNRIRVVLDGHKDSFYRGVSFAGIQDHYDGTQDYHVNSNNYKSLVNIL
jgi:hypothetical protein